MSCIKQASFFSVPLDYFRNNFLSLSVVDETLIGRTFLGKFGSLTGFGNVITFSSFQGFETWDSRRQWLNICVRRTSCLLGRCLRHSFRIPPSPQSFLNFYEFTSLYMVTQEECARLREGVPYVKIYRYYPKHLCPKLNGYGDNGQRKVWSSASSTHCTSHLTRLSAWPWLRQAVAVSFYLLSPSPRAVHSPMLTQRVTYSAWNSKDSYEPAFEFFCS
jgi:hypothetical protein